MWTAWQAEHERRRSWGDDERERFDERYRRRSDPSAQCEVPPPPPRWCEVPAPPPASFPAGPFQFQEVPGPPQGMNAQLMDVPPPPGQPPGMSSQMMEVPLPPIQQFTDTSWWAGRLRTLDEEPAPAPELWKNPEPPPPTSPKPRKRKLEDADTTLFRPGYRPLDPAEASRGAKDILAASRARAAARNEALARLREEAARGSKDAAPVKEEATFDGLP